jgi:hypothetical protein
MNNEIEIQGHKLVRLTNDEQIKKMVKDCEKHFAFYEEQIKKLQERVDNIKLSILEKKIS